MTPLPVDRDRARRHEVAAAILAAFASDAALDELRRRVATVPRVDPNRRRFLAGVAAASRRRSGPSAAATDLAAALEDAACLVHEGLFFEAHERLESEWRVLAGRPRSALQGLIQLVVALHHLAHGNARGAASLCIKARARLEREGDALDEVDVPALLADFLPWGRAIQAGRWPTRLAPPALVVRRVSSAPARPPSG